MTGADGLMLKRGKHQRVFLSTKQLRLSKLLRRHLLRVEVKQLSQD